MIIDRIDHIVLTVKDVERTVDFYSNVLGMEVQVYGGKWKTMAFGQQRINLHELGSEVPIRAQNPTPGSADICLIASTPIEEVIQHVKAKGVEIEEGPIMRAGALGQLESIYFRDPDNNLVEVSNYPK
ncbi:VOC family protein [Bacillus sp. Marseille-P3661]|uniref:VOC family protein n=1 Tax=Bacillus sp. Marseille-P3661 TaxID=1936234 RepID=UPI000C832FA7|nr:VOC family protein [Bacillus sp. Marseille-P3661]